MAWLSEIFLRSSSRKVYQDRHFCISTHLFVFSGLGFLSVHSPITTSAAGSAWASADLFSYFVDKCPADLRDLVDSAPFYGRIQR